MRAEIAPGPVALNARLEAEHDDRPAIRRANPQCRVEQFREESGSVPKPKSPATASA